MAPLRHGIHPHLEAEADRLIFGSMKGVTKYSEKSDVLTPWKENVRNRREVFNVTGLAEPTTRAGLYNRAANQVMTHLNSVPSTGMAPTSRRMREGTLSDHVQGSTPTPSAVEDLWR